jgi:hypothetical protein
MPRRPNAYRLRKNRQRDRARQAKTETAAQWQTRSEDRLLNTHKAKP